MRSGLNLLLALCAVILILYAVWEFNLSIGEYVRRPVMGLVYSVAAIGFLWAVGFAYLRRRGAIQWDWRHLLIARFVTSSAFYAMWNFLIFPIGDSLVSVVWIEVAFTAAMFLPAAKRQKSHPLDS